jgi:hypothetical protein
MEDYLLYKKQKDVEGHYAALFHPGKCRGFSGGRISATHKMYQNLRVPDTNQAGEYKASNMILVLLIRPEYVGCPSCAKSREPQSCRRSGGALQTYAAACCKGEALAAATGVLIRWSKALKLALAPSPMAMMICL